jgi:hypothetical protein
VASLFGEVLELLRRRRLLALSPLATSLPAPPAPPGLAVGCTERLGAPCT